MLDIVLIDEETSCGLLVCLGGDGCADCELKQTLDSDVLLSGNAEDRINLAVLDPDCKTVADFLV